MFRKEHARILLAIRDATRNAAERTRDAAQAYFDGNKSEQDWINFRQVLKESVQEIKDSLAMLDQYRRTHAIWRDAIFLGGIDDLPNDTKMFIEWHENEYDRERYRYMIEMAEIIIRHTKSRYWSIVEGCAMD